MNGEDARQPGVFVYHPLNRQTPLFAAYTEATRKGHGAAVAQSLSAEDRMRLVNKYKLHMRDVMERRCLRSDTLAPDFEGDRRALVGRFLAFFPALVKKTMLRSRAPEVAIFFPAIDCFDNRCVEVKGHGEAIFITSRALDVIELFANTLSMCVRLNGLELSAMLGFEDPPPPHLPLTWMTMRPRTMPDIFMLDKILERPSEGPSEQALQDELYTRGVSDWMSEEVKRGWGHYRLSMALTWLMLRAINGLVRRGQRGGESYVGVTAAPTRASSILSLDSDYLATLILTFIVLHEIGHFALGHNRVASRPGDPVLQQIVEGSAKYAAEHGAEGHNLMGTHVGHETGADAFALDVIEEDFRDPVLEATTLWCAALAGTNDDCGDWVHNVFAAPAEKYPGYPMRVWFLNGRFSKGKRQGHIAQEITRQAEALASALGQDQEFSDESSDLFRKLWAIAAKEAETA